MKPTRALLFLAAALVCATAEAGHEITFYPSYYPQEITVRFTAPATAAALLRQNKIHAYAGGDPFVSGVGPAHVRFTESLGGLVVLAFKRTTGAFADADARCGAAAALTRALAPKAPFVVHPYPVTPYHEDYLLHYDVVQRWRDRAPGRTPRVRALGGPIHDALTAAGLAAGADADATLLEVSPTFLLAETPTRMLGWIGPPWFKEGWFHAWLLQTSPSPAFPLAPARLPEALFRRRTNGDWKTPAERVDLERRLVAEASAGCERVVLGYSLRREPINDEYSNGIQNVAVDSQAGLASDIFVRTVKLKDFPWNGWLSVAVIDRLWAMEGAWNPVAGFSGAGGRLVWAAIGDPALLPDPDNARFVANRARPVSVTAVSEAPADAVAPATLRPLGAATPAASKILYRVLLSKTHDGQRMAVADILYPYAFAARWSGAAGGRRYDAAIERATALARRAVVAVRVLGVNKDVKELGDMQLMYDVAEIEVYLRPDVEARDAPAVAPPWSPVPWQVVALMEEAVARGLGAFSKREAERRNVRWLDLVNDRTSLASLASELARTAFVPEALRGFVSAEDARARWAALREFARTHGHFLPTAGPYVLGRVSKDGVTLPVFRDFSYPLGVGSFDQYPIPLHAFVVKAERRGERLEIQAEVESIEKFERSYKIVREPFRPQPPLEKTREPLTAHWVVLGPGDEVAAAGASRDVQNGRLVVDLAGRLKPGAYRVLLALALNGNLVNPEVKQVPYRMPE
ncbi:MAG TPA: hypothetical protein VGL14_00475 [Methylomirabilota bacterium]